jgi:hypothetical protein
MEICSGRAESEREEYSATHSQRKSRATCDGLKCAPFFDGGTKASIHERVEGNISVVKPSKGRDFVITLLPAFYLK